MNSLTTILIFDIFNSKSNNKAYEYQWVINNININEIMQPKYNEKNIYYDDVHITTFYHSNKNSLLTNIVPVIVSKSGIE